MESLTPQALVQVADYFQALAEPTRLRIRDLLHRAPRCVGERAQVRPRLAQRLAASRAAGAARPARALALMPIDNEVLRFEYRVIWHERAHRDPGLIWLRGLLVSSAASSARQQR